MSKMKSMMVFSGAPDSGKATPMSISYSMIERKVIKDELRRRKLRFLPVQVTRRIIADVTINSFKLPA